VSLESDRVQLGQSIFGRARMGAGCQRQTRKAPWQPAQLMPDSVRALVGRRAKRTFTAPRYSSSVAAAGSGRACPGRRWGSGFAEVAPQERFRGTTTPRKSGHRVAQSRAASSQ
jgi:hypothetical protein